MNTVMDKIMESIVKSVTTEFSDEICKAVSSNMKTISDINPNKNIKVISNITSTITPNETGGINYSVKIETIQDLINKEQNNE